MGILKPIRELRMTSDKTSRRLRRFVDEHAVLRHRFLVAVDSGGATRNDLIQWALQDRHVSYQFPRFIGFLISIADDFEVRAVLAENLWEEFGEGDPNRAHAMLLDNLLQSMGVLECELDSPPAEGTKAFLQTQRELATSSLWKGIGAFCYANEYLSLAEFRPLEQAIRTQFPSADLSYFEENVGADSRHTELLESLIDRAVENDASRADIEEGVRAALDARICFYDTLVDHT
jgi:pyrroloquinoline-quinone synthase